MPKVERANTYTCIRECFYQNKHFRQGDPFPEAWLAAGVPVGKHFAKTTEAADIIEKGTSVHSAMTAGDDKRSNVELLEVAKHMGVKLPQGWTRSQLWKAVVERENAMAKTSDDGGRQKGK